MPPLPAIPLPVLRSLEAQLRHAPRETILRDVERVEELARGLDTSLQYPHDWIVFRVTGFRPEDAPAGTVPGAQLLAALSPFAEVLCVRAGLRADELDPGAFVRAADLARGWGASPATLKRWRRAGLVTRRVLNQSGREEVWVSRLCAEHFRATHARSLSRVQKSDRLTAEQRERIVLRAVSLRASALSTQAVARQIAQEFGRSTEGIRHALLADPRTAGVPAGGKHRSARDPARRRAALLRLWRAGADPVHLASLTGKSVPLTRRDINLARAEAIARWLASGALTTPPEAGTPGASAPFPVPDAAGGEPLAVSRVLVEWRSRAPLPRPVEHAWAYAYHAARAQAARAASALNHLHPGAQLLDEAETALRAASQFRAALVHSQHRLVVETLETRAGMSLDRLLPSITVRLLRDAVAAASQAVDHFDPAKGGRLAGPVGLVVDRTAVRSLKDAMPARASTRAMVLQADTFFRLPPLSPWDRALLADPRVVRAARSPGGPEAVLLSQRFGLAGQAPRTLASLRKERGWTHVAVAHALQRALAHCLRNNPG
ncbi:MAG: hypothetical protein U0637_10585 [Phycisphaerales bacterium]